MCTVLLLTNKTSVKVVWSLGCMAIGAFAGANTWDDWQGEHCNGWGYGGMHGCHECCMPTVLRQKGYIYF